MSLPILYHCGKHLKMHCQGSKAEKSMPFLCKQTVSTSFWKLPEAALYLSCTVLIICPWTDNCCFPCMFSLSCCHKKWVPPHYSSQQQGLALGHQPLWLPMDFSYFTIFFLLFTDQGHSGLNAEIICISHMGSHLVKVKKNQPKKKQNQKKTNSFNVVFYNGSFWPIQIVPQLFPAFTTSFPKTYLIPSGQQPSPCRFVLTQLRFFWFDIFVVPQSFQTLPLRPRKLSMLF